MTSYPITLFPDLLTQEINIKSYLTELIEKPLEKPHKPVKQKTYQGCLIGLVFFIITAIVASGAIPLETSLPFGIAITIILWIVYSITGQIEHNKNLRVYDADYKKYLNEILLQNKIIEKTKNDLENLQKVGNESWKNELIKKRLSEFNFKLSSGSGKRGASEDYFINQIVKFYDCQIYRNSPINCKNIGFTYYPDIVLFFAKINVAIALEIDEPYTLKDGTPIHYYIEEDGFPIFPDEEIVTPGSSNIFTSRSKEITNEGYILIRFAEEQVVLQPDACCKYIHDRINRQFGFEICKKDLTYTKAINRISTWTFDEAKTMYRNNHRERYLKTLRNNSNKEYDNSEDNDLPF
jgi:hypothetical protein